MLSLVLVVVVVIVVVVFVVVVFVVVVFVVVVVAVVVVEIMVGDVVLLWIIPNANDLISACSVFSVTLRKCFTSVYWFPCVF